MSRFLGVYFSLVDPFVTKIPNGRSEPLGADTRTDNQHIGSVTVVQGNHVVQVSSNGVVESRGSGKPHADGSIVCLTFYTEDGHRFFRTYEYRMGEVTVTTSEPVPIHPWEDDPILGVSPSRLWHA